MIAMLDTSDDLVEAQAELGCPVEELLTPLTRRLRHSDSMYAIDNGAFSGFHVKPFLSLLERERGSQNMCRFVVAPDVVASARRTLEVFNVWQRKLACKGWRVALAAQDGLEELDVPWGRVDALFIGGSTGWKLGRHAADFIRTAKMLSKWVHVGRVNTPGRFEYFEALGADSIDGVGMSRFSHMREAIWRAYNEPTLFAGGTDRVLVCGDSPGLVGAAPVLDSLRENAEGPRSEVV